MDDILEQPSSEAPPPKLDDNPHEQSSEDEDEGLDWTKLKTGISRPVIPERGEKEHEPAAGGESGLQQHILQWSRNAMFDALSDPDDLQDLASIPGTCLRTCCPRNPLFKYGSFCVTSGGWQRKAYKNAYAEMIGTEDVTLEKYQVYSYLRQLGYVVTRTVPPTSEYPAAAPFVKMGQLGQPRSSIFEQIRSTLSSWILKLFTSTFNWWKPLPLLSMDDNPNCLYLCQKGHLHLVQHLPLSWWRAVLPFLHHNLGPPARRLNLFVTLRAGKKTVVVAAVDSGNISFF
ncbi:uncharacterized protein BT62DRAFT_1007817 [Guyanagaster necrorhizus]|uniref:Uncharacterized protein n=1 Tax=Guyanagaster necrorhizus TaxID=856835 RepID=A0A9P7VQL2_9AGAR|nr:uncharacterized protein BT62DRAFT_1007817 [Guyanagaster necrorhizus MCA 3950]KAG7444792.1 hypothetical protein BT62DRAFT_1007817 [Guyanagaster necrorhizus MCA 3950]